ncbi:hypothetical protein K435DRAFT_865015 [Dendrothele bispora CBS 962.96]|uniref:Uncharacterized protein n=1 Tax=Dendrothele bispora (strain CBS 962.96) TaxID=1314807 RepID=A0A4S8LKQ2_DENBC|nr:hypothetical protein K435DRAFT_865015 [Dendrothele bispora CBS 962.96]
MSSPTSDFLGCSPTLYTLVGPNGLSRQNFKYYVIHGQCHAGVYLDQSVASARAKATKEREPKGYNDEEAVIATWKFICQSVHRHPPQELQPFISPFGQPSAPPVSPPNERHDSQDLTEAARLLSLRSPAPSPRRQKVASTGGMKPTSDSSSRISAEDLVLLLTAEAAPFPHTSQSSPGKTSAFKPGTSSGGTPNKPSPTKRGATNSSAKQRFTKSTSKANEHGYNPSRPRNVKVQELGSGFPTSESEPEDREKKGKEKEDSEPCQFFIVRYRGGCDAYSSQSEAMRAFVSFKSKGMAPQMRVTEDEKLAEEFMVEKLL